MDRGYRPDAAGRRRRRLPGTVGAALVTLLAVGACSAPAGWTETPFQHEVADAASTASTAANLLEAAHTGRLTNSYRRGALVNLREVVDGLEARLPTLDGAPDAAATRQLLDRFAPARSALDAPCIDAGCDWRGQVDALRRAADAFVAAGEAS